MISPYVEDWRAALELRAFLAGGGVMQPLDQSVSAVPEPVYTVLVGSLDREEGVALAFASSDPTSHARARQWRTLSRGHWHLTSDRLILVESSGELVSLGWNGVKRMGADDRGLLIEYPEGRFRVNVRCPQWLYVAVNILGYRRFVALSPPDWVTRELERTGK